MPHVRRGRRVLREPGGPADLERHPAGGGPRVDQLKCYVRAGGGEQPRALADDHREDEEGARVDQIVGEQPLPQGAAAVHQQLADGDRDLTGEDGRVRPLRVGERVDATYLGRVFNSAAMESESALTPQ